MLTLRLPIPVSVNAMYANGKRGRYKTKKYTDWTSAADKLLLMQKPLKPIEGPYTATIRIPKTRSDPDNRIKATLDYLVSRGLTSDDKHCRGVSIEVDNDLGMFCVVEVRAA